MRFQLLEDGTEGQCGFEEYSRERKGLARCGRPAVATAGKTRLCAEHAAWAADNQRAAMFHDSAGRVVAKKEFLALIKAATKEAAR